MRGFIYTLTATLFVTIALIVLLLVSNSYYKDNYSNTLFMHYLSINTLNMLGINISYDHGVVIETNMPFTQGSTVSKEISSFYDSHDNRQVSLYITYPITLTGPVNLTIYSSNRTEIIFNGNATIVAYGKFTHSFAPGDTFYNITLISNSSVEHYSGYISGTISSPELNVTFGSGNVSALGSGEIKYIFDTEGTFLSNIQYFTNIEGQRVYGFLNVRI